MKKTIIIAIAVCLMVSALHVSAASYDNNEFQKKSRAYSAMATQAFDEGDYDKAVSLAEEAEKFAELSAAFIEKMIAKSEAESTLFRARTRLAWATEIKAERNFPAEMQTAASEIDSADSAFGQEDYAGARRSAESALAALSVVREIKPLPAQYRVDDWDASKDCLWNIAANKAVYGDPLVWEKLYEANKRTMKQPSNPHLLVPGQIITIPSLRGELREGMYDPSLEYEPFRK